jgi:sugar (pentulose or hexulose) kinase
MPASEGGASNDGIGRFAGIDFGTSGCRGIVIDGGGTVVARHDEPIAAPLQAGHSVRQKPELWWDAFRRVLAGLSRQLDLRTLRAVAIDGTSGSFTIVDERGEPVCDALMYNDSSARTEADEVAAAAPRDSAATGVTSPLAKLLGLVRAGVARDSCRVAHQADWIAGHLLRRVGLSDESNSLKMGYDPIARRWPGWLHDLGIPGTLLPEVLPCGTVMGRIAPEWSGLGFAEDAVVVTGATDGVASFLATGADRPGDGVTALGSTLVIKQLCETPIFAPDYGIYSHRLGDMWLAGGASNSGGAVLAAFFEKDEIERLSAQIDPGRPSGLDYYPLIGAGERFPISDARLAPRLSPRPADRVQFLHGLLEGIAGIERLGYQKLRELGAPPLNGVRTVGGGAANAAWATLRRRVLGVDVVPARHSEAAYGSALLARRASMRG